MVPHRSPSKARHHCRRCPTCSAIGPHLKPGAMILTMPAPGNFDMLARQVLGPKVRFTCSWSGSSQYGRALQATCVCVVETNKCGLSPGCTASVGCYQAALQVWAVTRLHCSIVSSIHRTASPRELYCDVCRQSASSGPKAPLYVALPMPSLIGGL
jgi:hypothetical protein